MKDPKRVIVNYFRMTKDGEKQARSMGFAYVPEIPFSKNVDYAVGFVEAVHNVVSLVSVVLKY